MQGKRNAIGFAPVDESRPIPVYLFDLGRFQEQRDPRRFPVIRELWFSFRESPARNGKRTTVRVGPGARRTALRGAGARFACDQGTSWEAALSLGSGR